MKHLGKCKNRTFEFLQNKRKVVDKEFEGLKSGLFQHDTRTAGTLLMQVNIHGNIKAHKRNLPYRCIISCNGTLIDNLQNGLKFT